MNAIVELLNKAGYKNNNSNRERSVRNMNLLIDSGIMSLTFINAESYNLKENGRGFWMMCNDGIKRPTAYKVTLYGKSYYGHIMTKSVTTKHKHIQHSNGKWDYVLSTEYYDNTCISINEIQTRVAQLITIIRNGKDFFDQITFGMKGECSCSKCNGLGIIPAFSYYANGICFDCGGTGINRNTLKKFINNSLKLN